MMQNWVILVPLIYIVLFIIGVEGQMAQGR